jgi:hypothetical protein
VTVPVASVEEVVVVNEVPVAGVVWDVDVDEVKGASVSRSEMAQRVVVVPLDE